MPAGSLGRPVVGRCGHSSFAQRNAAETAVPDYKLPYDWTEPCRFRATRGSVYTGAARSWAAAHAANPRQPFPSSRQSEVAGPPLATRLPAVNRRCCWTSRRLRPALDEGTRQEVVAENEKLATKGQR